MRMRTKAGFTLVEILIVVVILGILAAIVIPQFTSASQEAIKGALSSQLSTIESQFELFRVRNQGAMPAIASTAGADPNFPDTTGNHWAVLVSAQYLKEEPVNQYIPTGAAGAGNKTLSDALTNIPAGDPTVGMSGWGFRAQDLVAVPPLTAKIFAMGFDLDNNLLSNEAPDPNNPAVQYDPAISP